MQASPGEKHNVSGFSEDYGKDWAPSCTDNSKAERAGGDQKTHQSVQHREKNLSMLHTRVESINGSAGKAVEDIEDTFTQMIHLLEKRHSVMQQQVRIRL